MTISLTAPFALLRCNSINQVHAVSGAKLVVRRGPAARASPAGGRRPGPRQPSPTTYPLLLLLKVYSYIFDSRLGPRPAMPLNPQSSLSVCVWPLHLRLSLCCCRAPAFAKNTKELCALYSFALICSQAGAQQSCFQSWFWERKN
jgi:hypothetical protein